MMDTYITATHNSVKVWLPGSSNAFVNIAVDGATTARSDATLIKAERYGGYRQRLV
jgi:hypothetical protein